MPWFRLIEWYLLAAIGIRIIGMIVYGRFLLINPDQINVFPGGQNNNLFLGGLLLGNLTGLLVYIVLYLLFVGLSHTIRYLLAMKDTIGRPTGI